MLQVAKYTPNKKPGGMSYSYKSSLSLLGMKVEAFSNACKAGTGARLESLLAAYSNKLENQVVQPS